MFWLTGVAAAAADDAAQRQRIARERAEIEQRTRLAQAACAERFAVSACMAQARSERRAAVQQLDHQTALLDDAQRKQRAAERQERLRQRREAEARQADKAAPAPAAQARERTGAAPGAAAREDSLDGAAAAPARKGTASAQSRAQANARARADAAQRASASQERAQQADAHRKAIEQRNLERAEKKRPSPPLPLPPPLPASAAPRN